MRIMTDDAGDVPANLLAENNIYMVPVNIMFGTEEFLSGEQMPHSLFYEKVKSVGNNNFPKTSQPTPFQYVQAIEEVLATGETEIYILTVSEKLSGTYASAIAAAKEIGDRATIHIFDTKAASAPQGFMTLEAARMAAAGADAAAITAKLEQMRDAQTTVFMINTLEFAVRGGRVGALRGTVASLLNIKPIMRLENGEVVEAGRVRTPKKAQNYIINVVRELAGDKKVKLAVIHANAPDMAQALMAKARTQFNVSEEMVVDMTLPVAINLGPGALGLMAIPEA